MRKIHKLALPCLVAIALLSVANPAQAGEPLHPIFQPVIDFFSCFRLF